MQAMPIKHGTGRCNLKKYAKRVLFKTDFAVFWAEKEVLEAPNRAQSTLRGSLKRSARAVQLFGHLAVLETHTLRY